MCLLHFLLQGLEFARRLTLAGFFLPDNDPAPGKNWNRFPMRLFLWITPIFLASPAWADPCEQLPKPSVSIKRLDARLGLNTTYSYRSLTNLGASAVRPGQQVLGLTRGNVFATFSSNTPMIVDRTNRWECASPQITLTYGYNPITVYVAREFPPGGCAYKEIYDHEMRHVKTYEAHLAAMEKILGETLNERFATGGPWRGPLGQVSANLQRELNERWLPFIQRELKRVEEAQARIDTPEEYDRVANACDGEVKKRTR